MDEETLNKPNDQIMRGTWIAAITAVLNLSFLGLAIYLIFIVGTLSTTEQMVQLVVPGAAGLLALIAIPFIRRSNLLGGSLLILLSTGALVLTGILIQNGLLGMVITVVVLVGYSLTYLVVDPEDRRITLVGSLVLIIASIVISLIDIPFRYTTPELINAAPIIVAVPLIGFIFLIVQQSRQRVLPVGARIAGGFVAMLLILVILAVVSTNALNTISTQTTNVVQSSERLQAGLDTKANLWELMEANMVLLITDSYNIDKERYFAKLNIFENQLAFWASIEDSADMAEMGRIQTQTEVLKNTFQRQIDLIESGELTQAIELQTTLVDILISGMSTQIGQSLIGEIAQREATLAELEIVRQQANITIIAAIVVALIASVLLAVFIGRTIVESVGTLIQVTRAYGAGDRNVRAQSAPDEIGTLAVAFNDTIGQLNELYGSLEQRVTDRTRALETSVEVGRRISTILDENLLAEEVVNQVQRAFGYYHAHIYFFDEKREILHMAGGTGKAGKKMLENKHSLQKGRGLVGRAAERNIVVFVPDVFRDTNWLPNPLLPETRAEVAIPIAIGEDVIGVLDVQHNVPGGLDQGDVALLQSLAGQVAITLQNSRSYQATQRQVFQEVTLNTISQKIQSANTVEKALQVAVRELGRATGMQNVRVKLNSDSKQYGGS